MAEHDSRTRALPRWEVGVFVGAMILRLWVLARYSDTPYAALQMGDMKFYHEWAVRILHGQWSDGHAFYGLPGYAYLLAGFYKVLGTDFPVNWMVIGVVQSVWEALTCVLIFKIAKEVCAFAKKEGLEDWRRGLLLPLLASLGYASFVPAQAFSIILMPTAWLVCAFWFCVWQAMQPRDGSLWRWLGLGLLIGAMAMMIATIFFVLPLLLAAIALGVGKGEALSKRSGRGLLAAGLLLTGVGIGTAPAWIHNYFVVHDPVLLSAHGGLNFWMGNGPGATGYPKIPEGLNPSQEGLLRDSIAWAERAAGHPIKRAEVSRYWSDKASAYIHAHPGEWASLMRVKIRNFWNTFQYDDISVITLMEERGIVWRGLHFGTVAGLGLAGLLLAWGHPPARWVAAAVLLHMAALLSVFITERYRLAAVPGLLILGVYVLAKIVSFKEKPWSGAIACAFLLLAGFATQSSSSDPALLAVDPYNLGVKELAVAEELLAQTSSAEAQAAAKVELAHARGHLERAYELLQGNPGILFALGNFALDSGDSAQAEKWYRATLKLSPGFAGALKNLGYLKLQDQQWAAAADLLEAARIGEPENASTWYLLAKAKIGLGDLPGARALLQEALRMKPQQPEFLQLEKTLSISEASQ